MTSGQPKTTETSEAVEITEQVVQKKIYGQPEAAERFETVCTLLFCHTAELSCEIDPRLGENTQANNSLWGSKHVKKSNQTILSWDIKTPKYPSK